MAGFYSIKTSTPNTWAYQMFPGGTPYSITNPQDSIGNLNDGQLTNFDWTVDSLERNSVAMMNNFEQMYKMYQAQIAEWSKNVYPNISANTNMTIPGMSGVTPGATPGRYSSVIEDSQVATYISRLGSDPLYGPELKKQVTLDNGDKVTYLKRLDDLIKDYLTAETPLLSAEDFAKIKEIAGKLAKTGKITKADFLTLKKIVDNNKGELGIDAEKRAQAEADKKAKEEKEAQEEADKKAKEEAANAPVDKPYAYQQTVDNPAAVDSVAQNYYDAMHRKGTSIATMELARPNTNRYNVIEIIDKFQELSDGDEGLSLIEYICDDFDNYGTGRSNCWFTDDDMKPYVKKLADSMIERVADLAELKNANGDLKLSKNTIDNLHKIAGSLKYYLEKEISSDVSDNQKTLLKKKFTSLVDTIKKAEIEAYGRDHQYRTSTPAAQV